MGRGGMAVIDGSSPAAAVSLLDQMAIEQAMAEDEEAAVAPDPSTVALIKAAETGDEPGLWAVLESGDTPVDSIGSAGTTGLMEAATHGHVAIIGALLEHGASTSAADAIGWTALHFASYNGNLTAVQSLLSAGADADARSHGEVDGDTDGQTALDLALEGCADKTASPRRRFDRREVASFLLRESSLPPALVDEALGQLPDVELNESGEQLEDTAAGAMDEVAAAELELQELEMQLELEELEAELAQQEIEAEEALTTAELELQFQAVGEGGEGKAEEEGEDEEGGEDEEQAAATVQEEVTPGDFRMQSFYALPMPSAERDAPCFVWAEPLLTQFYAAGREVCCRDDDALLASVISSTTAPPIPIRRLIFNCISRISANGLRRFATKVRHLQDVGAWPHHLEIVADDCGPWAHGELAALRGVALSKLDISGLRGITTADVACLAAGIRLLQHQGVMGRDFTLVARSFDWGPNGETLMAWCGVAFGMVDLSRFASLSLSSMRAFFRSVSALQRAGQMTTAFALIARYCDWAVQGIESDDHGCSGLLMGIAQAGVAFSSIDLSSAQHLGAAALREFSANTATLQQVQQERPSRQVGTGDDPHGSVRMSLNFELVARFCIWEPGELEALCHVPVDEEADVEAADARGNHDAYPLDKERNLVLGKTPGWGLSLSLLDISGATSMRLHEVTNLTRALRSVQMQRLMHSKLTGQGRASSPIALTLKATDCDWTGGLLEPWGSVVLKSIDISNAIGLKLGDVYGFGTRLLATQVQAQTQSGQHTMHDGMRGLTLARGTNGQPSQTKPLMPLKAIELIATDCERIASDVDWTQEVVEQNSPIVQTKHLAADGDYHVASSATAAVSPVEPSAGRTECPSSTEGTPATKLEDVDNAVNRVAMDSSLSKHLQRKGMSNWLLPLQQHLRLKTARQLRHLEVADLQRLALLSGWTLTDVEQQQWQAKNEPRRHGAGAADTLRSELTLAGTGRTVSSLSEQLASLKHEMEEATAAGDYDRLAPLANLWGRLAHPKQPSSSATVGAGTAKSAEWNWNSFSTADLQRIHSILVADLGDEATVIREDGGCGTDDILTSSPACTMPQHDDLGIPSTLLTTTQTLVRQEQRHSDPTWVHHVLRYQVGLNLSSATTSARSNDANPNHTDMSRTANVQRSFQFERKSIGEELSIAAALGVLPGGVEAIGGRRGPQATQGAYGS